MTRRQFKQALDGVAYVVPIEDGQFEIRAFDGTPLAVMDSREAAYASIIQHEFEPVSLH